MDAESSRVCLEKFPAGILHTVLSHKKFDLWSQLLQSCLFVQTPNCVFFAVFLIHQNFKFKGIKKFASHTSCFFVLTALFNFWTQKNKYLKNKSKQVCVLFYVCTYFSWGYFVLLLLTGAFSFCVHSFFIYLFFVSIVLQKINITLAVYL